MDTSKVFELNEKESQPLSDSQEIHSISSGASYLLCVCMGHVAKTISKVFLKRARVCDEGRTVHMEGVGSTCLIGELIQSEAGGIHICELDVEAECVSAYFGLVSPSYDLKSSTYGELLTQLSYDQVQALSEPQRELIENSSAQVKADLRYNVCTISSAGKAYVHGKRIMRDHHECNWSVMIDLLE